MNKKNKKLPQLIRDISWLSFNGRVLQEAQDPMNHILDRLKFLGIFSNNLDEFFRVRVATLMRMSVYGNKMKAHLEEHPEAILRQINTIVEQQQIAFRRTYLQIIKELHQKHIYIRNDRQINKDQKHYIKKYFFEKVYPRIVPLMISTMPNFPLLKDRAIYLACTLCKTCHPEHKKFALIEIPTSDMDRFVLLPSATGEQDIILLEDIIRYNLLNIFAPLGYDNCTGHIIKVTRDAELDIDNDVNINFITSIQTGLKNRKKGKATRFVFDRNIDEELLAFLTKKLGLTNKDYITRGGRIHNFKDFMNFPSEVFHNITPRPQPFVHPLLEQPTRMLDVLDQQDVMLHFPYHSFESLIDLLREAAIDPNVKSIKITAYRLASNSKIANALINAAKNGKKVWVCIELRARFDEEANLYWKNKLEEEGVKVFVGIPNMKVHAKLCIIERVEKQKIIKYGFLSTGNFNENTAKLYTDTCLLTSHKGLLTEAEKVFDYIAYPLQNALPKRHKHMIVAPNNMRDFFVACIDNEIKLAKKNKRSEIILKLNSLVDPVLIQKLYEAATAGVKIQMIVRGICCAITKHKSFKNNIHAISIVDQYLEHSRIIYFSNNNNPRVFVSSADWMVRNLDHRVECAFEVYDMSLKEELIDMLAIELTENVKARILDNKQKNEYVPMEIDAEPYRSQYQRYLYLYSKY
jgi:polyphosphate kinase